MKLWAIPYLTSDGNLMQKWVSARRHLEYEKQILYAKPDIAGLYEPIEHEVPVRKESMRDWLDRNCSMKTSNGQVQGRDDANTGRNVTT